MSTILRRSSVAVAALSVSYAMVAAQQSATPATVRVNGIVVGLPRAEAGLEQLNRVLGPTWSQERVSPDGSIVVFRPGPSSRAESAGPAPRLELAESWERAHELVRAGATFAELDIEVDMPQGEPLLPLNVCPPCPPQLVGRYDRGKNPIQDALKDPEWSLKPNGANVEAAWQLVGDGGTNGGRGVNIAHPDTGYTAHPEFFTTSQTERNVFPEDGWDYLDNDADPLDVLLDGLLRNPGHGTKTGSVIVSRRGSAFNPGATRWVSGVAPGARLTPLRVTEGVVLSPQDLGRLRISSVRLAQAIFDAAAGRRPSGDTRRADVISISLGGLPSIALKAAVDFAATQNVIVVAAAGNQVRRVVFPGGYSNVMGVAASNFNNKPWKGSSRGRRVKITAPGESVWSAAPRPQQWCLQASDGTSFATATTAGIAALWLAYHREHTQGLTDPQPGAIPAAFHAAVAQGFRPVDGWDTGRYGPGIIDAHAVIKATSLPSAAAREEAIRGQAPCASLSARAELDALSAVLDDAADSAQRAGTLLGLKDPCTAGPVATEIVTLYEIDDEVAAAIDALAGSPSPSAQQYRRVRDAILRKSISATLRQLMSNANAQ